MDSWKTLRNKIFLNETAEAERKGKARRNVELLDKQQMESRKEEAYMQKLRTTKQKSRSRKVRSTPTPRLEHGRESPQER